MFTRWLITPVRELVKSFTSHLSLVELVRGALTSAATELVWVHVWFDWPGGERVGGFTGCTRAQLVLSAHAQTVVAVRAQVGDVHAVDVVIIRSFRHHV